MLRINLLAIEGKKANPDLVYRWVLKTHVYPHTILNPRGWWTSWQNWIKSNF